MAVEDIIIKMGLDARPITAALRGVRKDMASFKTDLSKTFSAGVIGGTIAAALGLIGKKAFDLADRMQDLSDNLDVSTDSMQRFSLLALQTGASAEKAEVGIGKVIQNIGEALQGNEKAIASFAKLNISVQDLASRDNDQNLELISKRIGDIEDPAKRVAIAMELAGRGGRSLVAAFSQFGKGGKGGIIISDENIRSLDLASDKIKALWRTIVGIGGNVMGTFARAYTPGADMAIIQAGMAKTISQREGAKRIAEKTKEQVAEELKETEKITGERKKQAELSDKQWKADSQRIHEEYVKKKEAREKLKQDIARNSQELAEEKTDRNRLTLEQLAGMSLSPQKQVQIGKFAGIDPDRDAQILKAREAMRIQGILDAGGLMPGQREKLNNISDKLKGELGALKNAERNPFQQMEDEIAKQTKILISGEAKFQAFNAE